MELTLSLSLIKHYSLGMCGRVGTYLHALILTSVLGLSGQNFARAALPYVNRHVQNRKEVNNSVLWDVMSCSQLEVHQCFGVTSCLRLQD
jgi:hypothetical protein